MTNKLQIKQKKLKMIIKKEQEVKGNRRMKEYRARANLSWKAKEIENTKVKINKKKIDSNSSVWKKTMHT